MTQQQESESREVWAKGFASLVNQVQPYVITYQDSGGGTWHALDEDRCPEALLNAYTAYLTVGHMNGWLT